MTTKIPKADTKRINRLLTKVKYERGSDEEFAREMVNQMRIENLNFPEEGIQLLLDKNYKLKIVKLPSKE